MRDKEVRRQKRLETLGSNNPACAICGERDWRILELHHLAGRAYDDFLAPVCRNCHRKLSDDQKDHPAQIGHPSTKHESIGHLLLGLADFLALLVEKLRDSGRELIQLAREASRER
jgi:hypothetical protein